MIRAFIRSAMLAAIFVMGGGVAQAADRTIETTKDADYFGFDLRTVENVTIDGCQQACLDDGACKAFTYNVKAQWCFLKSDFKDMKPFKGAVAGKVVEAKTVAEPDIGAAPPLDFLTEYMSAEAQRYREALVIPTGQEGQSADNLAAMARLTRR